MSLSGEFRNVFMEKAIFLMGLNGFDREGKNRKIEVEFPHRWRYRKE